MKPVIGITCQNENLINRSINRINTTYVNAILEAGGVPIIIPIQRNIKVISNYVNIIDGLLLSGGEDISSLYFGEEPIREVEEICHDRDMTELELFRIAYEMKIPIMGICRGHQLINVALGGKNYQDIYKQIPSIGGHTCDYNLQEGYHSIEISPDSVMNEIFHKERITVNSLHHQAIKEPGDNLKVTARAMDGVIEAVESTNDNFILGVQFHPEAMAGKHKEFKNLFSYFINKCS